VLTIVGNGKIFGDTIQNFSALPVRRVDRQAQLAAGVDPLDAIARLRQAVIADSQCLHAPPPEVSLLDMNLIGPVIAVRPYTHTDHYWQVYFDTNEAIVRVAREAGWPAPSTDPDHARGNAPERWAPLPPRITRAADSARRPVDVRIQLLARVFLGDKGAQRAGLRGSGSTSRPPPRRRDRCGSGDRLARRSDGSAPFEIASPELVARRDDLGRTAGGEESGRHRERAGIRHAATPAAAPRR
jgi:hypothetical protein